MLCLKISTLSKWDRIFDQKMKPLLNLDLRGKAGKVTAEIVREIIRLAEEFKGRGKCFRLKPFVRRLREKTPIDLSQKTITEILIANDLYRPSSRRRRPKFYQSLKQGIPNGLLSLDGSEMKVVMGEETHKFNVELAVDVKSFHHDAYSITDTENAEGVIETVEERKKQWGTPLGVLVDHGTANLSREAGQYLEENKIELVPVGPGNPKGNGTDEGAFSQMEKVIGPIVLDTSSPRALAQSVLNKVIEVYCTMRNRTARVGESLTPEQAIARKMTGAEKKHYRERYRTRRRKSESPQLQKKRDRIDWLISYHNLEVDRYALDRAYKCIIHYDLEAINKSEEAFIRAIRRKSDRRALPYFFGILKRIQNDLDVARQQAYCRRRYHYREMRERERQQREAAEAEIITVKDLAPVLQTAVTTGTRFIREFCLRQLESLVGDLRKQYQYTGALKRKIIEALGEISELSLSQRREAFGLVERYLV